MPASPRRAVFTSLGVISPVGDTPTFWANLLAGTPGVRAVRAFDPSALPCRIAGETLEPFDAKKYIPSSNKDGRKSLKNMAKTVQLGLCGAQLAMDDGGPAKGTIDPFRFGIEFGCVMVASELEDLSAAAKHTITADSRKIDMAKWGHEGVEKITPLWMLKYLPNMPACHTSIFFDSQGPNNTITAGDVASTLALGEAFRLLQRDAADYFLVGGCDSKINPLSFTRNNLFVPFTRNNDHPATAVRPFDKDRDGTALGEAAALFGLEDLEHAKKRGAKVYAELAGFASGFDRGRKGPILAGVIRNALKEAGITPADVDHVNTSAGGLPELDAFEARAIHEVFGTVTPVYALKGQIGNTGAASGAIELAASILALKHGQLPGTVNHAATSADCPVTVHVGEPRPVTKPYAVKINYTDLGQCAVAVVKKFE
ncbi:beta-ketoacyl-[acyl-carrier-protein] synthase family protein [Limnoglobus roseus]|nr:beta-ketoacyl-[acyl-carrier-protein] synthase family protein [Limnoglobus roseus]